MMAQPPSWLDEFVEEPMRALVGLLRENGFNTEASCGHEMYVQCQYLLDGEIMRLHNLLFISGYRRYEINVTVKVDVCGCSHASLEIRWPASGG